MPQFRKELFLNFPILQNYKQYCLFLQLVHYHQHSESGIDWSVCLESLHHIFLNCSLWIHVWVLCVIISWLSSSILFLAWTGCNTCWDYKQLSQLLVSEFHTVERVCFIPPGFKSRKAWKKRQSHNKITDFRFWFWCMSSKDIISPPCFIFRYWVSVILWTLNVLAYVIVFLDPSLLVNG